MSKLEELIQQLCPDGVEYKRLGDVLTIKTDEIISLLKVEVFRSMALVELWRILIRRYMINPLF